MWITSRCHFGRRSSGRGHDLLRVWPSCGRQVVLIDRFRIRNCACNNINRVVDVGSEWRTFANDNDGKDMSRVGAVEVRFCSYEVWNPENQLIFNRFKDPSMGGADLSTTIGRATGSAGFDENGMPIYRNRNTVNHLHEWDVVLFVFKWVKILRKARRTRLNERRAVISKKWPRDYPPINQ